MAFAHEVHANDPASECVLEFLAGRLRELRAILRAIEAGELLSELPAEAAAREAHTVGLSLLEVMSRELCQLSERLDDMTVLDLGSGAAAREYH